MQTLTEVKTVLEEFLEGWTMDIIAATHGVRTSEIEECLRWQMRQRVGK